MGIVVHPGGARARIFLLAISLLAAILLVAAIDHERKTERLDAAQVSEWYCEHRGERCGGPASERIERSWHRRELGYKGALGLTGIAGLVLVVRRRR